MSVERSAIVRATTAAVKLLAARALTRYELEQRLARRGHDAAAIAAVTGQLADQGLLNDRAAAESGARADLARGAARALAEERLRARGVEPGTARIAVSEAAGERSEGAAALALARKRVRLCPARLDADAMRRRVFAYLARRGYDEETARSAVERAVSEVAPR